MSVDKENLPTRALIDGSLPASAADIAHRLDALSIEYSTISHPPMRTVEDSIRLRNGVPGGYSKNLFLRNKKGLMWLVTLLEDRDVDLRALGERIGAGRVSFASPQRLMHYLGVLPGAVTPFAVINDKSACVTLVFDGTLLEREPLHFHPCDNTRTTTVSAAGLMRFLQACQHEPVVLDFD